MMAFYNEWRPYVPVSQRRANAAREASKLVKKGQTLRPIRIESQKIAKNFWGIAWCDNLAVYADWANRMPRGRTYARNGSIVDLQIQPGVITALVSGSSLYKIKISIDKLKSDRWQSIRTDCSQHVSSLLDLMRGKLADTVLKRLTDPAKGMFPSPKELKLECSCPDYATMCKHVAATLYGVGHLLDSQPELFFQLRGVDQSELVVEAMTAQTADRIGLDGQSDLDGEDLSELFGIDLANTQEVVNAEPVKSTTSKPTASKRGRKSTSASTTGAKRAEQATPKAATVTKERGRKSKEVTKTKPQQATTLKARKQAAVARIRKAIAKTSAAAQVSPGKKEKKSKMNARS